MDTLVTRTKLDDIRDIIQRETPLTLSQEILGPVSEITFRNLFQKKKVRLESCELIKDEESRLLLRGSLPAINTHSTGPISIQLQDLTLGLYASQTALSITDFILGGAIEINNRTLAIRASVDHLQGTMNLGFQKLPSFSDFADLVGIKNLTDYLPPGAGRLGEIQVLEIGMVLKIQPLNVNHINFRVTIENEVELLPKLILLKPFLYFAIDAPFVSQKRRLDVQISGAWDLGTATFNTVVSPLDGLIQAELAIGQTLDVDALVEKILPGVNLPDFKLMDMSLRGNFREQSFSAEIDVATDWEIDVGGKAFSLIDLDLSIAIARQQLVDLTLGGRFLLADNELEIQAIYEAGSWKLEALTPPGAKIDLKYLISEFLSGAGIALPAQFPEFTLFDLGLSVDLGSKTFQIRGSGTATTPFSLGKSVGELQGSLDVSYNPAVQPSFSGQLSGILDIAGTQFTAMLDLGDTSRILIEFSNSTKNPLGITTVFDHLVPGITLPDEIPDFTFTELSLSLDPQTRSFSANGTALVDWDLGPGQNSLATGIEFSLTHTLQAADGNSKKNAQVDCSIRLHAQGPLQINDDFSLSQFDFEFGLAQTGGWTISGTVVAELFGKAFTLSAGFSDGNNVRTLRFATSLATASELVSIDGIAAMSISDLAIEIAQPKSQRPGHEIGQLSSPASEISSPQGTLSNPQGKSTWSLSANGAIRIDDVLDVGGTLSLFNEADGSAGLRFVPSKADVRIPLPIPDNEMVILIQVGGVSVIRSRAPTIESEQRSGWSFEAAVTLAFQGLPRTADDIVPDQFVATLKVGNGAVRLTADRVSEAVDFRMPPIEIDGKQISLGTAWGDMTNLAVTLGREIALSVDIGLGLPNDLNAVFGKTNGKPTFSFFRPYDPEDPANSTVKAQLALSTKNGLFFTFLSSPIKAIQLIQENGKSYWIGDFGEFGEIRLQVPVFSYNAQTSSFVASGGFDTVRPLQLPLTPIKQLFSVSGLQEVADVFPNALPLKGLSLLDKDGNFNVEGFVGLFEAVGIDLPVELRTILEVIGDRADHLSDRFKGYLNVTIPTSFFFDFSISPGGNIRVNAGVKKGDPPIRIIIPPTSQQSSRLYGIELSRLAFGPILGGSLFMAEVDGRVDKFDLDSLAISLLLPDDGNIPLPSPRALQNSTIMRNLFMVIVYKTVIPIPIPIFYDELGYEYLDYTGTGVQCHVRFPMPKFSGATFADLFRSLKPFITDRDILLDPNSPPGGTNLAFSLDNNYLQLPEYLGDVVLGQKDAEVTIDSYAMVAQLMNFAKKPSLNRLVQSFPLDKRTGSLRLEFFFWNLEADWLITTPGEFRRGAYKRLAIAEEETSRFAGLLPATPAENGGSREPRDEEGLVVFLRGRGSLANVAKMEMVFGLAGAGSLGFQTGFQIKGMIAGVVEMEIAGFIGIKDNPGRMLGEKAKSPSSKNNPKKSTLSSSAKSDFSLMGHSHFTLLDRSIFQGDIFLSENQFKVKGALDLFPPDLGLTAKGNLEGEISQDKIYLAGAVEASLGELELIEAKGVITHERIGLEGRWLGGLANLDVSSQQGNISLKGQADIDMNLSVDFGPVSKTIGSKVIKVADGFRLDLAVKALVDLELKQTGFSARVTAQSKLPKNEVTAGPFELEVVPSDIETLIDEIRKRIVQQPITYFDAFFSDALTWLAGIEKGAAIQWTLNAYGETTAVLQSTYGLSAQAAAKALKQVKRTAIEIGNILSQGYKIPAKKAAQILRDTGFPVTDVGQTLKQVYRLNPQSAVQELRGLYDHIGLGNVLKNAYGQRGAVAAQTLRGLNYSTDNVAKVLSSVYRSSTTSVVLTLRTAGYPVEQVGGVLKRYYRYSPQQIASTLSRAGFSAVEGARALRSLGNSANVVASNAKFYWRQSESQVPGLLRSAGYPASQVNNAVKGAFKSAGKKIEKGGKKVVKELSKIKKY